MKRILSSLGFRIIGGIICLLLAYNLIVQTIGYLQFTESLTKEYNDSAFRTAETAVTLVDGDKIDEYLRTNGDSYEYRNRQRLQRRHLHQYRNHYKRLLASPLY